MPEKTRQIALIKLISLVSMVFFSMFALGQSEVDPQLELTELQQELRARQGALQQNQASAKEVEQLLAISDREIGDAAKQLAALRTNLEHNKNEQASLQQEQESLENAIIQQQSLLSSQLKSAFMAGHYDYAKMLFYQEDARNFERMITYYQYVAGARKQTIDTFTETVNRLKQVVLALSEKAQELVALEAEQSHTQAELVARQQDRKQTLQRLNQLIATDAQRIERLKASEKALLDAIEAARLAAERAVISFNGLAELKGKLALPVEGRVRRLFGNRRQGQVRWKGVIIDGAEGDNVRTIASGKVLYADWLRGFGLVTIVDHGEGYMSVYGHNQALLKQAGDEVLRGESIALVGQSGGQSSPNLYFEIRHKGKALNPTAWLTL